MSLGTDRDKEKDMYSLFEDSDLDKMATDMVEGTFVAAELQIIDSLQGKLHLNMETGKPMAYLILFVGNVMDRMVQHKVVDKIGSALIVDILQDNLLLDTDTDTLLVYWLMFVDKMTDMKVIHMVEGTFVVVVVVVVVDSQLVDIQQDNLLLDMDLDTQQVYWIAFADNMMDMLVANMAEGTFVVVVVDLQ